MSGRGWLLNILGVLVASAALALAALFGGLWLDHRNETSLPDPTGPFAVGRTIDRWSDAEALDALAPIAGTKREVLVWIWYPAAGGRSAAGEYVPAAMQEAASRAPAPATLFGSVMTNLLTRDVTKVRAHNARDAEIATEQPSYPVAIMRAGASTSVLNYSTLAEDLASHGYVVVGVDAPYRTGAVVFPDGRVIRRTSENNPELLLERKDADRLNRVFAAWIADMRFVVDRLEHLNASDPSARLTGRLDMTRIGVFGHSWGGAQAMQFCADDPRCKAVVDIDGAPFGNVIQSGLAKPLMFLFSDLGDFSSDAENRQIRADVQTIYDRVPNDDRLRVSIAGANHFTFSDDGALLKSGVFRGVLRAFGRLRIDGRRQLEVTAYAVRTFFDAYLKGASTSHRSMVSSAYPEIQARD